MESFLDLLLQGSALLWSWSNMLFLLVGICLGFLVGALPGFTSSNAVAVMLPFTLSMPMETGLIFMAAVYCSSQYGGAIPAILLNTPGTPGAAATALDGYPMSQRGEAGKALALARVASSVGGSLAAIIVIVTISPLAQVALSFGQPEKFVLAVFGLSLIASVAGKSLLKGLAAGALGLLIAAMAAEPIFGQPRLTFGFLELFDGVPFVPVLIGVFAIGEMLFIANQSSLVKKSDATAPRGSWREIREGTALAFRYPITIIRSAVIGLFLGTIPGIGTAVSNFISYGEARRWSRKPERFGTGIPEGVLASEAADNATTLGTMIPTFVLGIPGGATAAVMLVSLMLQGVFPGPDIMQRAGAEVFAVLLAMLLASLLILPLGLVLGEGLKSMIFIPVNTLIPLVVFLSLVGAFAVRNSLFDVWLAIIFGAVGYLMRLTGFPTVPLVLGLILGPIAEGAFARSMMLSRGDWSTFFSGPINLVMWALIVATLVIQPLGGLVRRRLRASVDDRS